jgi:hypothetical protein
VLSAGSARHPRWARANPVSPIYCLHSHSLYYHHHHITTSPHRLPPVGWNFEAHFAKASWTFISLIWT